MPFQEIPTKVDFPAQERELLAFWKETSAFQKLRQIHQDDPHWSFIDGPITANNPMGVHHGWGRTYKDLYPPLLDHARPQDCATRTASTARACGWRWRSRKRWASQSKKDIEDFRPGAVRAQVQGARAALRRRADRAVHPPGLLDGLERPRPAALAGGPADGRSRRRSITVQGPDGPVTDTVEQIVGRLGLPELGGSYFTFSNENNYMIWTFLKKCWEKGWLYRGADVMPWCPRCATGISQHEIVTDGYAELTHPSVTLRFPLRGRTERSRCWSGRPRPGR